MDFDFSDDQEMLRDSVRRWVERGYDFERRRAIVKAGGFSRDAWQEIADHLGVTKQAVHKKYARRRLLGRPRP